MSIFVAINRWEVGVQMTTRRSADWTLRQNHGRKSKQQSQSRERPARNLSTDNVTSYTPAASFGFVMRDFARRVLSRQISSSNVLVIAPDATTAAKEGVEVRDSHQTAKNPYDNVDFQSPYSIGGTFLLHAAMEGHDLHAIDFGTDKEGGYTEWGQSLDDWWQSFEGADSVIAGKLKRWSSVSSTPKWIIAAIFDHFDPTELNLVDKIWAGADRFLSESTMTYVVVAMHSRKVAGSYEYGGLLAAKALLDHRYKLQTLQLSHYHTAPGKETLTEANYGPNAIFKKLENVQGLLRWGADIAQHSSGGVGSEIFTAYVFATQGLDLAIPSNRILLNNTSTVIGEDALALQMNGHEPITFKTCPQATMKPTLDLSFKEVGIVCSEHFLG
jgi:hypothetical protein